jgi:hypothetical protein
MPDKIFVRQHRRSDKNAAVAAVVGACADRPERAEARRHRHHSRENIIPDGMNSTSDGTVYHALYRQHRLAFEAFLR